ncbi:STAS-like domain-containing protein [Companilactobacillus huachuanensis]|uniref:STAS-like domain-containing protein n=1 Tax=Companilactobacillus huachuanensis TaxID=2559914 RepID=A0ABW1RLN8_9LACO|nr:STAS-like domain-containing protein [Companilactobacillus huachuanensis]
MDKKIIVKDIIESPLAVNTKQGKKVFEIIKRELDKKNTVDVDFSGLTTITTAFLNLSIGKLYSLDEPSELNKRVKILSDSLTIFQKQKIQRVMENAKIKISDEELNEG